MDGIQKTVYIHVEEFAANIREGVYGFGDDMDVEKFSKDLTELNETLELEIG